MAAPATRQIRGETVTDSGCPTESARTLVGLRTFPGGCPPGLQRMFVQEPPYAARTAASRRTSVRSSGLLLCYPKSAVYDAWRSNPRILRTGCIDPARVLHQSSRRAGSSIHKPPVDCLLPTQGADRAIEFSDQGPNRCRPDRSGRPVVPIQLRGSTDRVPRPCMADRRRRSAAGRSQKPRSPGSGLARLRFLRWRCSTIPDRSPGSCSGVLYLPLPCCRKSSVSTMRGIGARVWCSTA